MKNKLKWGKILEKSQMSDADPCGSSDTSGWALCCAHAIESNYYVVKTTLFPTHPRTYPQSDLAWPGLAG